MDIVRSTADMMDACRRAARPLGLAPTMGALHAGHLSLVDRSLADNAATAVSIFVNPTQFGADEDLSLYPRDLDGDLELLRQRGAALVFVPDVAEVYPPGFDTWVDVGPVAERLEGTERPGHFRGVATVVAKLFNIVRPDRVYFGQKDGQQTVVVRKLVRDLDMGLEIVVCPTVREEDGPGHEQPQHPAYAGAAEGSNDHLPGVESWCRTMGQGRNGCSPGSRQW